MSLRKISITATACIIASASAAFAEWFTKSEEDVFSGKQTATMIGASGPAGSVYLNCDADRNVNISIIFPFKEDIDTSLKGLLVIKVDSGEALRLDAEAYQHNDKYAGFKARLDDAQKVSLLKSIASAKKKILAGLSVESIDSKHSIDIAPGGSTKAATSFMKACEIS
ncbi:hypothetical protein G6L97_00725 [Agrobacterium tumefaciens]|uniref:hypothetical protein n=1 Tax=Agrobacterium tumefaciens TaxID=358 RepID=UPI001571BF3A|nr:hypothetical protein [Agrobacterium tumefaciens]NSZ82930.1 hypothetical protein [Agrobacterium tumefaciens]WCA69163.1 hypothetical protein G6L97_00725 [Agrobacterium tumefaciens]